jgi:hypothetical protein
MVPPATNSSISATPPPGARESSEEGSVALGNRAITWPEKGLGIRLDGPARERHIALESIA